MKDGTIVINTDDALQGTKIVVEDIPTFELVSGDDPILRKGTQMFDFANPPVDPNAFASSLVETCKKNNGIGLAAPQCGFSYRVFVIGVNDNYVAFFNPEIISISERMVTIEEGCLSFPYMFAKISRAESCTVRYQDFTGELHTIELDGMGARCFLHEYDHLTGDLFLDKVKPIALSMAKKKRDKILKKIKRVQENERLAARNRAKSA